MGKQKRKRKGDAVQIAHSVMQDVIAMSEKPVLVLKRPSKRVRR